VDGVYEALRGRGYDYGPVFRGLRAAWRRGDEVFAEVALPEGTDGSAFGLHPALLDACLHPGVVAGNGEGTVIPFAWNQVTLHAAGVSAIRVLITRLSDSAASIAVSDTAGRPVLSVGSLVTRSVDQFGPGSAQPLFAVQWHPVPAAGPEVSWAAWADLADDDPVPGVVVYQHRRPRNLGHPVDAERRAGNRAAVALPGTLRGLTAGGADPSRHARRRPSRRTSGRCRPGAAMGAGAGGAGREPGPVHAA
jgi:hypothetical protein